MLLFFLVYWEDVRNSKTALMVISVIPQTAMVMGLIALGWTGYRFPFMDFTINITYQESLTMLISMSIIYILGYFYFEQVI